MGELSPVKVEQMAAKCLKQLKAKAKCQVGPTETERAA